MRVAMCRPDYFRIDYELSTNPLMNKNRQPEQALAMTQWFELYRTLTNCGVAITEMPPREGLPDLTFMANAGLPLPGKNVFILSRFYHPERRGESELHKNFFSREMRSVELHRYSDAFFEGQGDAFFWNDRRIFIGYGIRTTYRGIVAVSDITYEENRAASIIPLPMNRVDERTCLGDMTFYHLDMCLLPLRKAKKFFLYAPCFRPEALRRLKERGDVILATTEQAHRFVCNGIELPDQSTVIVPWADTATRKQFADMGYELVVCPTGEFHVSGGGPKCLVLEI